jgi:hypothetical protein
MVAPAIGTARAAAPCWCVRRFGLQQPHRGADMYPPRCRVPLTIARNSATDTAIAVIDEAAWTRRPIPAPYAIPIPASDSDAQVAEIAYTAFASTPITSTPAW